MVPMFYPLIIVLILSREDGVFYNELETRVKIVKEKLAVKKREKCGFCGYKKN